MLVIGIFAAAAVAIVLVQGSYARRSRDFLAPGRQTLHYSPVQIICGDCAGDALIPARTFMDRHGRCERCGSRSYMLASQRAVNLKPARIELVRFEPSVDRTEGETAVPVRIAC